MKTRFAVPDTRAVQELVWDLRLHFQTIRDEAMAQLEANGFSLWPEDINKGGWAVHGLHWQGKPQPSDAACTLGVVEKHKSLVANAAFSVLLPGAEIAPHNGYTGEVLRLHYGLLAPSEAGCELVCGGERRSWCDMGVFCFDDTELHSAHNRTSQIRIVLILDLRRAAL
jgi:beta-hydroxylase